MVGLWVDVFDADGVRLGDGPVTEIQAASVTRQLDGTGTFTVNAVASARSIELFTNEKRVKIYNEDAGGVRLIGQGIIESRGIVESTPGVSLRISGPDILDELVRRSTLLVRIFNQQTLQTVADELIALVPGGWSVDVDAAIAGNVVDARYDGASVLKSFRDLVGRYGFHFRLSSDDKVVSISQFGELTAKRVFKPQVITPKMLLDPNLLFVQRLPETTETTDLINWIVVLGAGEGVAALTLEKATRTSPFTVQSIVGPDGNLQYYLSDASSVATYGQIEKIISFKQIAPLTNSETDIINAANALYDAAAEWLTRHKDAIVRYGLTVKNAKENILPGDKIHVNYKGQLITPRGETVDYLSIRDDFWVMKVVERIGLEEHSVDLEISNIDQRVNSVEEQVADAIEDITLRNRKPLLGVSKAIYKESFEMAPTFPAILDVDLTNATLSLQRVRFKLKTFPFRTTVTTSKNGSGHKHFIAEDIGPAGAFTERRMEFRKIDGSGHIFNMASVSSPADIIWTGGGSPSHTHDPNFGIADDVVSPKEVTVFVNGVDKTTELFGFTPLAPTGADLDVLADVGVMTDLFINAAGGLRQEHEIEVRCGDQQGIAIMTAEVYEVLQSIDLG